MVINEKTKHIVCYSGGHSSAIVAIEVARRYGKDNVVLLNHDISSNVEDADVKRFKKDVANYLDLPITYANIDGLQLEDIPDQFDVCVKAKAFKVGEGSELCTSRLKTEPFMEWLKDNVPDKNCICYYGFDPNEQKRIVRRSQIMGIQGYQTDYPLAVWKERTIQDTEEIGIARPMQYEVFRHGNCFTGNTEFITSEGTKALKECVGEVVEVITRDGWKPATVEYFGKQKVVSLTLQNQSRTKVVEVTQGHRWIIPKHKHKSFGYQEVTTDELKIGDIIPSIYSVPEVDPDRLGVQHGFTFGDGSTYITSTFGEGKEKSRAYVADNKKEIEKWFDGYKTQGGNIHGLPSEYKSLPSINKEKSYLLGFIVGLICSDGSVGKSGITIANKDHRVMQEVHNILNKLGIMSWVRDEVIRDTNYKKGATLTTLVIPKSSFKLEWLIKSKHREAFGSKRTEPKSWKVVGVSEVKEGVEDVYCVVVDDTIYKEFVLDGNILTGNCAGCLKAGKQHWYIVYCARPDLFEKAKWAEEQIGYSIIRDHYMKDLELVFKEMKEKGISTTEHTPGVTFWVSVRRAGISTDPDDYNKPCECTF